MSANASLTKERSFFNLLRIQNWRMAPKVLAAFLIVGLLPIGISATIMTQSAHDAILKQGATSIVSTSKNTSYVIDLYLASKREDIVALSKLSTIVNYALAPTDPLLAADARKALQIMATKADYESIMILNLDRKMILSSAFQDYVNAPDTLGFAEVLLSDSSISDPAISATTNRPAIFFSAPIYNVPPLTNRIGVIRSRLNLNGIWSLVEKDKDSAGAGTFGILVDEYGVRLGTSQSQGDRDGVLARMLFTAVKPLPLDVATKLAAERHLAATATAMRVVALPEVAEALTTQGFSTLETTADNSTERHFAGVSPLSTKPWRYIVMTPISTFTSSAEFFRRFWSLLAICIASLAAIVALVLARGLTQPIVRLTRVADRISLGELDAPIQINRQDEIGELAEAFIRMQSSLQAAIERVRAHRAGSER